MGRFLPIYIRRSDGKLEVVVKGKRRERNEPTADQLDPSPDKHGVSDYYREVPVEDGKSLDWRRKLGGMLAREFGKEEKVSNDFSYILVAFPENYRLYEHVKKTEKNGKEEFRSKTHAAGGNDRQDAYLYGHPAGRRKRFRSPADFFPHLMWLVNDESGEPDNCACKICSPEDLEAIIPGAKAKVERPIKHDPDSITVASLPRQSSTQTFKLKQEPSTTSTKPQSVQKVPVPTPLPKPRSLDQNLDRRYVNFMYRSGELVWFQRGQAWALGVITRRWKIPDVQGDQHNYTVQPLSYPGHNPETVTKTSDREFRPWLAWSVPKFTHDSLNQLVNPPQYHSADWQGIAQKRYGTGAMEVDASIMAAKAVDCTYTPFGVTKTSEPETGVTETHYNGIYLGAEKIWAGDPVRLFIGSGTDMMIIHTVVERRRVATTSQPTVHLIGDVYTLATVAHRPGDSNPNVQAGATTSDLNHIPQRVLEDLRDRNNRSIAVRGLASYWKLMASQSRIDLDDVKGRWYEASLLIPILQQASYDNSARKGEVPEASLWMNARGDCLNSNRAAELPRIPRVNVRKQTRKEVFGKAVPASMEVKDGVEPPLPENVDPALEGGEAGPMQIDPKFDTADDAGRGRTTEGNVGSLDEFMNLDGADVPGFGQEYASQASQGGYF